MAKSSKGLIGTLILLVAGQLSLLAAQTACADDLPEAHDLNVTIPVFDPGIPADPAEFRDLGVFPRIREIEARVQPFHLREAIASAGTWGAVRVVSAPDASAELQVSARIAESDGDRLTLDVRAVDATGRLWLEERFSGVPDERNDAKSGDDGASGFASLFAAIALELANVRDELSARELREIRGVSLMLYASELAPAAFDGYVGKTADGRWRLLRLPAYDAPMLRRIELIRNTEFLITDVIDAKFRELNAELTRTFRAWREYRRKLVDYKAENARYAAANSGDAPRGSWEAIKDQYFIYKYDRITVQEQDRLAVAFNNEVEPKIEAMEQRLAELEGWVAQGYDEWRRLLDELHEVDTVLGQ